MQTDPPSTMLTCEEVADILGISKMTLKRWTDAGHFPRGLRFGRRTLRWPRHVVEAFLRDKQEKQSAAVQ